MIDLTGQLSESQDNFAVIQKALDQGGKILFPQGRFPIYQTLLVQRHGTTLIGEGGSSASSTPSTMLIARRKNIRSKRLKALMQVSAEECHFTDIVFWKRIKSN
ncbi:MAG: hypothetical protein IPH04_18845 [Saprospirales bacterium]|nr:hypothetical protein [Saprospirales bacterium]